MKPLVVLVLDRDPVRRRDIGNLLERAGHTVTVAEGGPLEERTDLQRYDLLVIDPALPGLSSQVLSATFSSADSSAPDSLDEAERRHVDRVLRHTSGNKRKAAILLGISRSTLLNKVRKYGLER
jgi:DNA-binding NtrC family response regulator